MLEDTKQRLRLEQEAERIAFAIVPVEVRYPDRIVGMALLLWSMQ